MEWKKLHIERILQINKDRTDLSSIGEQELFQLNYKTCFREGLGQLLANGKELERI
jgi:hypothetical protein